MSYNGSVRSPRFYLYAYLIKSNICFEIFNIVSYTKLVIFIVFTWHVLELVQNLWKGIIMKQFHISLYFMLIIAMSTSLHAAFIYESATLGATGSTNGGTSVNSSQFLGGRFQVTSTVTTTAIGGHFRGSGTFFGAIVELTSLTDFPDSLTLNSSDVLGSSVFNVFDPSQEVSVNLSVTLDSGFYAVIFGSGLFGASGNGNIIANGTQIGDPNFFFRNGTSSFSQGGFSNARFFVTGEEGEAAVPEPASYFLLLVALIGGSLVSVRR